MRVAQALLIVSSLLGPASVADAQEHLDLFNGKNLDGWVVEGPKEDKQGRANWTVQEGTIICRGAGFGFLRYERQQFADFAVRVEYRFAPIVKNRRGNSGLGIRTVPFDPKHSLLSRASFASYEIQLTDDAGKKPDAHSTGSLYRYLAPKANPVKPAPAWNTIEVECVGPRIKVRVNGEAVLDADQTTLPDLDNKNKPGEAAKAPAPRDKPLRGYIALQSHSGQVEFRQVRIRELAAAGKVKKD
jgi:hypothetical protein